MCNLQVVSCGYAPDGSDLLRWIEEDGITWEEYVEKTPDGYQINTRIVNNSKQLEEDLIPF